MATSMALEEAWNHFAEVISRVASGEEIVLERNGKPAIKMSPVVERNEEATALVIDGKRQFGQNLLGITYMAPDWDAPMDEEELKLWGM